MILHFSSLKKGLPTEAPPLISFHLLSRSFSDGSTSLGLSHGPEEPLGPHSRLIPTSEAMCFQENHSKGLFVMFTLSQNAFPCLYCLYFSWGNGWSRTRRQTHFPRLSHVTHTALVIMAYWLLWCMYYFVICLHYHHSVYILQIKIPHWEELDRMVKVK